MTDDVNALARSIRGRLDWRSVAFFYLTACAISWPIFWWRDEYRESWIASTFPEFLKAWAPAAGPSVAALLAMILFRRTHRRTVSLLGTSPIRSGAFAAVAIVTLALVGIGNDEPHLTGLWFSFIYVIYALGEETGWRGFLQDALRPLGEGMRCVVIGCLWGVWHFTTFLAADVLHSLISLAAMFPLWIMASWGIGRAVDTTSSLLVAAMLHLMFNFAIALPRSTALTVMCVSIPVWAYLLWRWPKQSSALETV